MEREQFDLMVARLEEYSRRYPAKYKLRVLGFALLGYAYLVLMVFLLLLLLAASAVSVIYLKAMGVKLLLVIAPFVWLVVRSCWVDIKAPPGVTIVRREAPALFDRIAALRRKMRAPRFQRVLITDEFNAGVVQVPRLGPVGWHSNYLLLGMPLLKSVTPLQLDAILAHEFGHLAGGHGRFGNWLYRLRKIWSQLLEELECRKSAGAALFRGFFEWYVPRFNAYSFPLARANEYQADAAAARATTSSVLAQALTSTSIVGRFLGDKFWPDVYSRADTTPQPSLAPFNMLGLAVASDIDNADVETWMKAALARPTDTTDTHPGLADRLRAFGGEASFEKPERGASAEFLLGEARESIVKKLDERWRFHISEDWRRRYSEASEARGRLTKLRGIEDVTALSVDELIELAALEESLGDGREVAITLLRNRFSAEPENAGLNYCLGIRLLATNDESGIAFVEKAMGLDEWAIVPGQVALRDYFHSQGLTEKAQKAHEIAVDRQRMLDGADAERQIILIGDKLVAHGLDADVAISLYKQIASLGVRKVWLARKPTRYFPESPLFLLAFSVKPWWWLFTKTGGKIVSERIYREVPLPGQTIVICTDGEFYRFRRKLGRMRGTRLRAGKRINVQSGSDRA